MFANNPFYKNSDVVFTETNDINGRTYILELNEYEDEKLDYLKSTLYSITHIISFLLSIDFEGSVNAWYHQALEKGLMDHDFSRIALIYTIKGAIFIILKEMYLYSFSHLPPFY